MLGGDGGADALLAENCHTQGFASCADPVPRKLPASLALEVERLDAVTQFWGHEQPFEELVVCRSGAAHRVRFIVSCNCCIEEGQVSSSRGSWVARRRRDSSNRRRGGSASGTGVADAQDWSAGRSGSVWGAPCRSASERIRFEQLGFRRCCRVKRTLCPFVSSSMSNSAGETSFTVAGNLAAPRSMTTLLPDASSSASA